MLRMTRQSIQTPIVMNSDSHIALIWYRESQLTTRKKSIIFDIYQKLYIHFLHKFVLTLLQCYVT